MTRTDELNRMQNSLTRLGYDYRTGIYNWKILWFFLPGIFLMPNTLLFITDEWNDIEKRITGIKGFILYVILLCYSLVFIFDWDRMILGFKVIKEPYYKFPYKYSDKRRILENLSDKAMIGLSLFWHYTMTSGMGIFTVPSIIAIIYRFLTQSIEEIDARTLLLMFPLYFPKNVNPWIFYFIGYVMQCSYFIMTCVYCYFSVTMTVTSLRNIESELKLLQLTIEEMDDILLSSHYNNVVKNEPSLRCLSTNSDQNMKSFLRYIIQHHNFIYRKAIEVKSGMQWFAFFSNSGVSLYICMGILYIVKSDDILMKIQEVTVCFMYGYCIYEHDLFGERISSEDERLRRALCGCSWYNKPQWFKKSLQIMMARANKPIVIKPVGLFAMNLTNFSKLVNAAYSYFNVLINLK